MTDAEKIQALEKRLDKMEREHAEWLAEIADGSRLVLDSLRAIRDRLPPRDTDGRSVMH